MSDKKPIMSQKVQNYNFAMLGLASLLVLQIVLIGLVGYNQYATYTNPKAIVKMIEKRLESSSPALQQSLEKEIKESAPIIAKKISEQNKKSIPQAREELEDYLARSYALGLRHANRWGKEEMREFVRAHKDEIRRNFKELEKVPDETKKIIIDLEQRLEETIGTDIQEQAKLVLSIHHLLNKKLENIVADRGLDPDQLLEKRMVRILRALQLKYQKDKSFQLTSAE